jgi:hypothetical protein
MICVSVCVCVFVCARVCVFVCEREFTIEPYDQCSRTRYKSYAIFGYPNAILSNFLQSGITTCRLPSRMGRNLY